MVEMWWPWEVNTVCTFRDNKFKYLHRKRKIWTRLKKMLFKTQFSNYPLKKNILINRKMNQKYLNYAHYFYEFFFSNLQHCQ